MNGIVATASIDVSAPADRVWAALTEPDQIAEYMFGSRVETDWTVGGPITWNGEYEGRAYQDKGEVLAFEPTRRLAVTHFSPLAGQDDVPENYHTLVYELTATDAGTTVDLSQDNNGSEEEAERATATWTMMLEGLKKHVEGS